MQVTKNIVETYEIYPDPLYTMIMLGLCEEDGTKLSINKHTITIEPPGLLQTIKRTLFLESRDQLVSLTPAITRAIQWFPIKDYPDLEVVYKKSLEGIIHIYNTYSHDKDWVGEGLEKYILLISSHLPKKSHPEIFTKFQETLSSNLVALPINKKPTT